METALSCCLLPERPVDTEPPYALLVKEEEVEVVSVSGVLLTNHTQTQRRALGPAVPQVGRAPARSARTRPGPAL